jgi:hypothetical protein
MNGNIKAASKAGECSFSVTRNADALLPRRGMT